jgi:hypothetical protein
VGPVDRAVAALVAALDGIDVLALTGGVGEHAATVRTGLADRLAWPGAGTTVPILIVEAREDLQTAAETPSLLGSIQLSGSATPRCGCVQLSKPDRPDVASTGPW